MSEGVPSREELLAMLQDAQKKGWPSDSIAEAFYEASIVSLWLEEFERCWKAYTCLAAYEIFKQVSADLKELEEKEDIISQKGVMDDYQKAQEEVKRAAAYWSAGDEDNALKHALKAREHLDKVISVVVEEDIRKAKELLNRARELITEIEQLEIPIVLEFDKELEPYGKAVSEAAELLKKKRASEARSKLEETVKALEELREEAEDKRKKILISTGVGAAGVAALGLLYAHKKGMLPKFPFPIPGEEEEEEKEEEVIA